MTDNKIPTTFRENTKIMAKLIKTYHHLQNTDPSGKTPRNIKRTQDQLVHTILPAFPNANTDLLKTANALNWSHTSIQILNEHYQSIIKGLTTLLSEAPKDDWENSLKVAIKWAKKDTKRISEDTIKIASTHILDFLQPAISTSTQTEPEKMATPSSSNHPEKKPPKTYPNTNPRQI